MDAKEVELDQWGNPMEDRWSFYGPIAEGKDERTEEERDEDESAAAEADYHAERAAEAAYEEAGDDPAWETLPLGHPDA